MGLGGHHCPGEARVAATLESSSGLIQVGPRVNEPRFCSFWKSAMLRSSKPEVLGSAYERMPRRTAMSTVGVTPVASMSLTKAVLGDCASASVTDSVGG